MVRAARRSCLEDTVPDALGKGTNLRIGEGLVGTEDPNDADGQALSSRPGTVYEAALPDARSAIVQAR